MEDTIKTIGNWKLVYRDNVFDGFFKYRGYKCGNMTLLSEEEYKTQSLFEKLKYLLF